MTDKVQRIRNEIKRLKNQYMSSADDFHSLGMEDKRDHYAVLASVMEAILNFIDSLQEEPVSVWHNASEKPERDDLLIETNDGRIENV
jgi:molecular chaperone GrpE (heat shock protein)